MKKHKCLIVDDEPHAIELIESYLKKFNDFEVAGTCSNAVEAIQFMTNNDVDLLFLDIKMPELTGLEMLRTLSKIPEVIIVTAYRDYAVESFEFNVLDYLLKPVPLDRFILAVNKYLDETRAPQERIPEMKQDTANYFFVNINKKMVKIRLDSILYIEGFGDYIKVYTQEGIRLVHRTLGFMEKKLPSNEFIRIHKSYVVAKSKVQGFTQNDVEIAGKTIPLGGLYKKQVLEQFSNSYRIL